MGKAKEASQGLGIYTQDTRAKKHTRDHPPPPPPGRSLTQRESDPHSVSDRQCTLPPPLSPRGVHEQS